MFCVRTYGHLSKLSLWGDEIGVGFTRSRGGLRNFEVANCHVNEGGCEIDFLISGC